MMPRRSIALILAFVIVLSLSGSVLAHPNSLSIEWGAEEEGEIGQGEPGDSGMLYLPRQAAYDGNPINVAGD